MKGLLLFLGLAFVGINPTRASAQQDGLLGSGQYAPTDVSPDTVLSDTDRGRLAARRLSDCIYNKRRKAVLEFFAIKRDSDFHDKAVAKLAAETCLRSGSINLEPWYYRGTLFRSAYFREFTEFPTMLSPSPVDFAGYVLESSSDKSKYYIASMTFAQCVVRQDPKLALRFISSYPGSTLERRAIASLRPNLASCAPAGSRLSLGVSMLEAVLSEVIYREAIAAKASRSDTKVDS